MTREGRVFGLESIVSDVRKQGGYFADFLKVRHIEAGVIVLKPGQKDTQAPHDSDELYYVVRGSGFIQLAADNMGIGPGSIVFVPAKMKHRFCGNKDELVVLYVFAEE